MKHSVKQGQFAGFLGMQSEIQSIHHDYRGGDWPVLRRSRSQLTLWAGRRYSGGRKGWPTGSAIAQMGDLVWSSLAAGLAARSVYPPIRTRTNLDNVGLGPAR